VLLDYSAYTDMYGYITYVVYSFAKMFLNRETCFGSKQPPSRHNKMKPLSIMML
jgi:hypothetical protein